jgi:hypothetical protein
MMDLRQSKRFDELDKTTKIILISLFSNQKTFSQDLRDQTIAVAQMLSRTEIVLKDQHDQTRALIVDAIQVLAAVNGGVGSTHEREHAAKIQEDEESVKVSVSKKILESLSFKTMSDRQEEIAEAHIHTFSWLFQQKLPLSRHTPRSNFVEWLRSGTGTYWINGKAGSGKSTLMRYICESKETKEALLDWAGLSPLTVGNFFFWNSGTVEQRSQAGLLRTLLHNILQEHPDLLPTVMPSVWARAYSDTVQSNRSVKPAIFTLANLLKAFKLLINQVTHRCKLCLFIDGLDEYDGEAAEMADLFTDLVRIDNLKVCLSSRPLVAFEYAFKSGATLRLQDLTYEDIRSYVSDNLHHNSRFQQLAVRENKQALALVHEIVTKADGVFLWVVLVVRSILVGLGNHDEIEDLERRLRELPSDLSALFDDMLHRRIEPFYQKHGAALFQIFRASREVNDQIESFYEVPSPLTLLALYFAHEKDPELAINAPIRPLRELEVSILCNTIEDRLKNCCAGLLEVQGATDGELGASRLDIAKPGGRVQYLHRTVKDYLEQPEIWKTITAHTDGSGFNPNILLLRSCLRQLKATELKEAVIPNATWRCVSLGLENARKAELSKNDSYVPLLDQLDLVMDLLLEGMSHIYPGHWARYYQAVEAGEERPFSWEDNTQALAVEYGLCAYLDYKFKQSYRNPCSKPGRPLLDYAVSEDPQGQRYGISADVVNILLRHGASPNERWHSTTPWENALAFAYRLQFKQPQTDRLRSGMLQVDREQVQDLVNVFRDFVTHPNDAPRQELFPKSKPDLFARVRERPDYDEAVNLLSIFKLFVEHGANLNASCLIQTSFEDITERRPALYIVKEVFHCWYPEESAELVNCLESKGASDDLVSEFTVVSKQAWKKVSSTIRLRFW